MFGFISNKIVDTVLKKSSCVERPKIPDIIIEGSPLKNIEDAIDPVKIAGRMIFGKNIEDAIDTFDEGDHIYVQRIGYTHHGIYIGHGRVIHYLNDGVQENSLEVFADDRKIQQGKSNSKYSKSEIANRAKGCIDQNNYNLLWNNCEQFAIWCRTGSKVSISASLFGSL